MKVHRIITTIEIENDDHSMTTVELTKLEIDGTYLPTIITNINSTGKASDIKQVYDIIDNTRGNIGISIKRIANLINSGLDK